MHIHIFQSLWMLIYANTDAVGQKLFVVLIFGGFTPMKYRNWHSLVQTTNYLILLMEWFVYDFLYVAFNYYLFCISSCIFILFILLDYY